MDDDRSRKPVGNCVGLEGRATEPHGPGIQWREERCPRCGKALRVHREEGREHPRSAVNVDAATAILAALGWRIAGETQGHLQRVMWFRRK